MKIEDIKKNLKPLIGAKLTKINFVEDSFVLEFSNNKTFTGQLQLSLHGSKLEADLRVICGYHGKREED